MSSETRGPLRVNADRAWDLHTCENTRLLELTPLHDNAPSLMQRAGMGSARLALALAPHARCIWVACGPGNNGGDGFEASAALAARGKRVVITMAGDIARYSPDAQKALQAARAAGVEFASTPPAEFDLGVDAIFGIGSSRPLSAPYDQWASMLNTRSNMTIALDVPSGLHADTGMAQALCVHAHHTLSLLTLKPGLFTGHGRDAAGSVWFDPLGVTPNMSPAAQLNPPPPPMERPHASHKGSYGDVLVVGGADGMAGAAVLAADAALHGGAGRVYLHLLGTSAQNLDPLRPELMLRDCSTLPLHTMTCVVGCGAGTSLSSSLLAALFKQAARLILDADALNTLAADPALLAQAAQRVPGSTVITPHPLEAARLLQSSAAQVQSDRLHAARALAEKMQAVVVLKGSGSVIAAPGRTPLLNTTGNARLATAGSGDVLAGLLGAYWSQRQDAWLASSAAVYRHGQAADQWSAGSALTAGALARAI